MNCPQCDGKVYVEVSRTDGSKTMRLRKCKRCNFIFYTEEKVVDKKDGSKELYRIANEYY